MVFIFPYDGHLFSFMPSFYSIHISILLILLVSSLAQTLLVT